MYKTTIFSGPETIITVITESAPQELSGSSMMFNKIKSVSTRMSRGTMEPIVHRSYKPHDVMIIPLHNVSSVFITKTEETEDV